MKRFFVAALALVAAISFAAPTNAFAAKVNDEFNPFLLLQTWVVVDEDSKVVDSAGEDKAFGFQAKRIRPGFKGTVAGGMVDYKIMLETVGASNGLKDAYATIHFGAFDLTVGQYKPFINFEGYSSAAKLGNMERSKVARMVNGGIFAANNSYRDLGAKFTFNDLGGIAQVQLSITNGGGANGAVRDVGGDVSGGDITSNAPGDVLLAVGVIAKPVDGLRINAAYANNKHDGLVANATGPDAINIDLTVYSVGAEFAVPGVGLVLDGEYSSLEDNNSDNETKGYYVRGTFNVLPKQLAVVARFTAIDENNVEENAISAGLNYYIGDTFKAQAEYKNIDPDGGDSYSAVRLNLQFTL